MVCYLLIYEEKKNILNEIKIKILKKNVYQCFCWVYERLRGCLQMLGKGVGWKTEPKIGLLKLNCYAAMAGADANKSMLFLHVYSHWFITTQGIADKHFRACVYWLWYYLQVRWMLPLDAPRAARVADALMCIFCFI